MFPVNRFRRNPSRFGIILTIILITISPLFTSVAHAQSYSPGVSTGQTVTFGQIGVTWKGPGPVDPFVSQLNQTQSITLSVTSVNMAAKNVTATQTYNYKNGTAQSQILTGNVQNGYGNLSFWIIAGGLSAGDPYIQGYVSPLGFLSETVARPYVGAVRSVNLLVSNNLFYNVTAVWDQSTGFLLELTESVAFYPGQSYTIHLKATATNAWASSSLPDFALDATPQPSWIIHLGQSAKFNLNLTSMNAFSGGVSLASQLLNSSLAYPPALSLSQNNVQVPSGGSGTGAVTLSTSASTGLGLYLFTVTGTSNSVSHGATLAVYVIAPDYTILSTPSNLTIGIGASKTSTITVEALGLFSGTVNFSSSSSSQLVQTSLDHSSVTLTPSVPEVNSTLTVAATPFSLPGSGYSVSVTGNSGMLQHSVGLPITVTGPDFLVYSNITTLSLSPGSTASAIIGLKSLGGFSGTVYLSGYLYAGIAVSFSPSIVGLSSGGSGQSTMTVSAPSNAGGGDYFVSIRGVSGILFHQTTIEVIVSPAYFSTRANPYDLTIPAGKNATSTITVSSFNGFKGKVTLAATVSWAQLGYALNTTSVTLTPGGSAAAKISLSAPSAPTSTTAFVDIYGESGNLSTQSSIFVTIQPAGSTNPPPQPPSYSIWSDVFSLNLVRGSSGTSTIHLASFNNFSGQLSLNESVSGGPSGTCPGPSCPTASLSPTSVTLNPNGTATSTLTITAAANSPGATYSIVVGASNGTTTQFTWVFAQVTVPDFSLIFNAPYLSLPEGGTTATPAVVLSSILGFTGSITLTKTITGPAGVCPGANCPTATLGATSLSLPANGVVGTQLTITTTTSTPAGSYNVVVNGTTGSIFHVASLYFSVGFKDFGVTSTPDTMILSPGGSGTLSVSLGSKNGFAGIVKVSTSSTSPITVAPTAKNVTLAAGGSTSVLFTISSSATAIPGSYSVSIQAVNGTITQSASLNVLVVAPDFGFYSTPYQATVLAGGSGVAIITLLSLDGLHGTVSLSTPTMSGTGCPGVTCPTATLTRSGVPLVSGGWGYSNLTISAPSTAILGYYTVSLTATNGTLTHSIYVYVDVVSQTSTGISCGTPVLAGTRSSCTVTVTNTQANSAAPSGSVTLATNSRGSFNSTCFLATATPTSATCSVGYTPTAAGSHTITANYGGDGTHGTSSGSTSLTANIRSSTTSIACTNTVLAGQASTCTVTVTDMSGSPTLTPSGKVTFTETGVAGYFSSSSCYLYGSGASSTCATNFTPLASGAATVNAAYAGDQAHTGSAPVSPATVNANPRTTIITVICNTPISVGQQSTCTATVTDSSNTGTAITPTGTVTFSSTGPGSLSANSCSLSSGSCTVTFTGSAAGTASVTGSYAGDSAHTGSTSTASSISITTTSTQPDFSLSINPSRLTIQQGSTATTGITFSAQNGFSGTVSLSANSPSGLTISFSPSAISGGQSSTVTVTASGTLAAGSYTLTVNGTSGSLTHQSTISVTVNTQTQTQPTQPFLGLPTYTFYALVGGIAGVSAIGGALALRRKKRRSSTIPAAPKN